MPAKLLQLCLTLCDPKDCSPPGSSVHGLLQARILEWVAMPSSRDTPLMEVKVIQSCLTLCDPMDDTVHGILQARILEWLALPFSRRSSQPKDRTLVSHIAGRFFTSWANREGQEYWSGYPIPSPVDLPNPGIEPGSPALQVDSLPTKLWGKPDHTPKCPHINDSVSWVTTLLLVKWAHLYLWRSPICEGGTVPDQLSSLFL